MTRSTLNSGAEIDADPKCDKCGAEITTSAMALFCPAGKDCEFWCPEIDDFRATCARTGATVELKERK